MNLPNLSYLVGRQQNSTHLRLVSPFCNGNHGEDLEGNFTKTFLLDFLQILNRKLVILIKNLRKTYNFLFEHLLCGFVFLFRFPVGHLASFPHHFKSVHEEEPDGQEVNDGRVNVGGQYSDDDCESKLFEVQNSRAMLQLTR